MRPTPLPDLRPDLLAVASLVQNGEKVADLGCGDGSLLLYLMEKKAVTARGVELSEAGVLACVRKGVSVRQGDLHQGLVDYPDQSFDTVILSYTIPYLNDPAFRHPGDAARGQPSHRQFSQLGALALPLRFSAHRAYAGHTRPASILGQRPACPPIDHSRF